MHVHFPPKQLAYGDPAHWSLKVQDWFKARIAIQTTNCIFIQNTLTNYIIVIFIIVMAKCFGDIFLPLCVQGILFYQINQHAN